ncbi:MAG: IPT/TIG domain-containing protein [Patescibacteria group bacterium]
MKLPKLFSHLGLFVLFSLLLTGLAFAHQTLAVETGLSDEFQQATGMGNVDVRIIIARVINIALGLLGVIAVSLIVYAGFLWMTAAGNPERVKKAQAVMINAIVGLLIILASYAITTYVLDKLTEATGFTTDSDGGDGSSSSTLESSSSVFSVSGASPQGTQTIKNLTVRLTFNKDVDPTTVDAAIAVTATGATSEVEGTYTVSDSNPRKVTFQPSALCDGYTDVYCFSADTEYTIDIDESLASTSGLSLTCGGLYDSCEYAFTSGSLVDTQAPDVEVSYPDYGESLEEDTIVTLQAIVTDDAGVSLVEFYVDRELVGEDQPDGETPTGFTAEYDWDNSSYTTGESYDFYAVAYDVDDNDATSDEVSATIRAAHCFNGYVDEDETGEDCGGEDCGECGGESCTDECVCASVFCEDDVCVDYPKITGISPTNGAVGTYVTISGTNFGSSTGSILFGDTTAKLADCEDPWDTDQVIAILPEGLTIDESYTITVTTNDGYSDTNQDDNGSLVGDFTVNETVRPGICELSPDEDFVGQIISIEGVNFEDSQGYTSFVYFSATEAGAYGSWGDDELRVTVPTLEVADYDISVVVNGVSSNTAQFTVIDEDADDLPTIGSIDPDSGPVGEYITISGENFGSSVGAVYFVNVDSDSASLDVETIADVEFPEVCEDDYWQRDQIIVKVPDGLDASVTDFEIYVERADSEDSDTVDFTLESGPAGPGVCSVEPSSGPAGYVGVTIAGENFGGEDDEGIVTFYATDADTATGATITSWDDGEGTVNVPSDAVSGPITLYDVNGNDSNKTNFEVGDCNDDTDLCDANTQQCCDSGACVDSDDTCADSTTTISSHYAWYFSTGAIPDVPEVLQECSDDMISPTPWDGRTGSNGEEVCVNAIISATFDLTMDQTTFTTDSILLQQCTGDATDPCASTSNVEIASIETTSVSFTATPTATFDVSSTYQVTLTDDITSFNGEPIEQISWTFGTRGSSELCDIASVLVTPSEEEINSQYGTANFNAQAVSKDACVILNDSDYTWNWSTDGTYADIGDVSSSCSGAPSSCQVIEGLQETLADKPTYVLAKENSQGLDDTADLTINFTDPYVVDQWPDCSTACVNASVIAEFNTEMDEDTIIGSDGVSVFECADEFCETAVDTVDGTVELEDDLLTMTFTADDYMQANSYYRVILSGEIASTSGVSLRDSVAITLNYNDDQDYSWTFKTRDDSSACVIDRIEMDPPYAIVDAIGAMTTFEAQPYGPPDDCSVSGQPLIATAYDWAWEVADTLIAELWDDGDIQVATEKVPDGCTSTCVSEGTQSYTAICGQDTDGDGDLVDTGEDCDDGNATDGDGCSASCEDEGTDTCVSATDLNCCGNATLDDGEECDESADGCSNRCLNEGSREAGTTCGDSIVTPNSSTDPLGGGEECDDGNTKNDDGCSSVCLNEGSYAVADLNGICGNRSVESLAEECDDGNTTDGDGCSSSCLAEGYSACEDPASDLDCCGNAGTETSSTGAGETCDDGNAVDGDGCSSACLLEGSSTSYDEPSFCGDATWGDGEAEACEIDASELDGLVEPLQITIIVDTAPAEVDEETKRAETSVTATAESEDVEASLILECSSEEDSDCSDEETYGAGTNGCCYARPEITNYAPKDEDACRNSAIYFEFDQEMEASSFDDNVVVLLELNGSDACPYSSTTVRANGFFGRLWQGIVRLFHKLVPGTSAQTTTCEMPVTFKTQSTTDGQRMYLIYEDLLEDDAEYTVLLTGDASHNGSGVRSGKGVGLDYDYTFTINTGSDYCLLEEVVITDTDEGSPDYFSQINEEHDYIAVAYSIVNNTSQELQSIPDVYAWGWGTWTDESQTSFETGDWSVSDETIFSVDTSADAEGDGAVVTAVGQNGSAEFFVTATIITDTIFTPSTEDDVVTGTTSATAFLCENPWPSIKAFPFEDSADAVTMDPDEDGVVEIAELTAYMNFSTYYCRDAGTDVAEEDYEAVDAVAVSNPPGDVLKEYLFEIYNDDVIGIRVVPNEDLFPVSYWYAEQGFTGSPSETTIDGYEALSDGRTTYVSVANASDSGAIYANVYAISYNANADTETVAVYDQMLDNWTFNTNLSNTGLCYEEDKDGDPLNDVVYTNDEGDDVSCTADLGCDTGNCHADKDKLTRDLQRLTDFREIELVLDEYGQNNGRCSATTSMSCTSESDCPDGESCEALYPELTSGTFLRSYDVSAWGSWSSQLSSALGTTLPSDPLNTFVDCGSSPFDSYDSATCWNSTESKFVCPEGSHTYLYRNVGGTAYQLRTDLEFAYETGTTEWAYDLDQDTSDSLILRAGNTFFSSTLGGYQALPVCNGRLIGATAVCGDGQIGGTEYCETGDTDETLCTATVCVSSDADYDGSSCEDVDCTDVTICSSTTTAEGTQATECNNSCSAYTLNTDAACVPIRCGNGVTEGVEECDDGSHNGDYGYCGESCTITSGYYCGDKTLAGGETCDLGEDNGVYETDPANSCNSTCNGVGPSCGDGEVNGSEECDTDSETYDGALCLTYSGSYALMPCDSDDECGTGVTCGDGDDSVYDQYFDDCPTTEVCESGSYIGTICSLTSYNCDSSAMTDDGECSSVAYPTTRTRACEDDVTSADACTLLNTWFATSCYAVGACGDGTVDENEECDDGDSDNNDSCTNECTANVCGDGSLYTGYETCDEGDENGTICDADFGETCRYCSATCNYLTASGDYCGDGDLDDGDEYCDASDFSRYYCYEDVGDIDVDDDGNSDTCEELGSTSECDGYTCTDVGVCNGGTYGGQYCSSDSVCGSGYECVVPQCADDCATSCPFTYDAQNVSITSEEAGASPQTGLTMYSYGSGEYPDEATINIPACRLVSDFSVDIDATDRTYGDVDIIFILDRSYSMADEIDELRSAVTEAVDTLFDAYDGTGGTMRIGIAYVSGDHAVDSDSDGRYYGFELAYGTLGSEKQFVILDPTSDEDEIIDAIEANFADVETGYGTPLLTATNQAINAIMDSEAGMKYVITFTDGNIYNTATEYSMIAENYGIEEDSSTTYETGSSLDDEYMQRISSMIDDAQSSYDMTFFTAALTSTACDITQLQRWSNNSCTAFDQSCKNLRAEGNYECLSSSETGLEYAYDATSADDLSDMFDQIVDSILGINVTITDGDGNVGGSSVQAGDGISISLPDAFECDETDSQDTAFHVYWNGSGTISFDNFSLDLCSP